VHDSTTDPGLRNTSRPPSGPFRDDFCCDNTPASMVAAGPSTGRATTAAGAGNPCLPLYAARRPPVPYWAQARALSGIRSGSGAGPLA
jgi:hypothetical protein